jgi:hypothetical protein
LHRTLSGGEWRTFGERPRLRYQVLTFTRTTRLTVLNHVSMTDSLGTSGPMRQVSNPKRFGRDTSRTLTETLRSKALVASPPSGTISSRWVNLTRARQQPARRYTGGSDRGGAEQALFGASVGTGRPHRRELSPLRTRLGRCNRRAPEIEFQDGERRVSRPCSSRTTRLDLIIRRTEGSETPTCSRTLALLAEVRRADPLLRTPGAFQRL